MNIIKEGTVVQYGPGGIIVCNGIVSPGGPTAPTTLGQPLIFSPDNIYDIGSADAGVTLKRPRSIYVGTSITISGDGGNATFAANAFGATSSGLQLRRARGTLAAPTAIQTGDLIGQVLWRGHDGASFVASGQVYAKATENWVVGANGTRVVVQTTTNGTAATTDRWQWGNAGHYVAAVDNTYDIGSEDGGTTLLRPRTIYVGTSVVVGSAAAAGNYTINGPATTFRSVAIQTAGVIRWGINGNADAEGGADAGTNLTIRCFTDAGVLIDIPVTIVRAAGGAITLTRPLAATTVTVSVDGAAGVTSGLCFLNQTNGAAAQAGTLANSPVAGNPTFWIPVNVGGALKHVPAW